LFITKIVSSCFFFLVHAADLPSVPIWSWKRLLGKVSESCALLTVSAFGYPGLTLGGGRFPAALAMVNPAQPPAPQTLIAGPNGRVCRDEQVGDHEIVITHRTSRILKSDPFCQTLHSLHNSLASNKKLIITKPRGDCCVKSLARICNKFML
jgi:hypothetical protein